MIDSYKNIERLRYRIYKDLLAISADVKKDSDEQRTTFLDECFNTVTASMVALFFTYSTSEPIKLLIQNIFSAVFGIMLSDSLLKVISAVVGSIVLLIVIVLLRKLIKKIKKTRENRKPEGIDTIDYVKEFDNIACDSVLVSMEYKDLFDTSVSRDEKTLYYLEAVHYLETACTITLKLCSDSRNIKSSNNVLGVNRYRVYNIKNVMNDLYNFMDSNKSIISLDESGRNELSEHLNKINKIIGEITI